MCWVEERPGNVFLNFAPVDLPASRRTNQQDQCSVNVCPLSSHCSYIARVTRGRQGKFVFLSYDRLDTGQHCQHWTHILKATWYCRQTVCIHCSHKLAASRARLSNTSQTCCSLTSQCIQACSQVSLYVLSIIPS